MEQNYTKIDHELPLIPLRGLAIFPYMILNFDIGREMSLKALDEAMLEDELVFLTSQKEAEVDEPTTDDFYHVGTICRVKQVIKLPGDTVRVLVQGISRAKIKEVKRLSSLYNKRLISKEPLKEGTTVEFKNGGSINVIPEGALHARKNNLTEINPELEGITKKGIPVISKEEGGEMIQHAEIERSEIIFNLETTKKLESLREQYNKSEDKAEKDNLAIEAGKLLAQQIMENTIDNTGELLK